MDKQLLIYEKAITLSSQRHADWSVMVGENYSFAKDVNSVPLIAAEFSHTAAEYPIVFAGNEQVMPIAVLGIRNGENQYVTKGGGWDAKYIPAFVRRYPFVFSSNADGSRFTLCIDEEFPGCNQEGLGERLFDDQKKGTEYLEKMLEFLKQYQAQFQRTQAFCKKLVELDVLEPMEAQVTHKSGQKIRLGGFKAVSRDRIKKLSGDQIEPLIQTNELELMYLHLHSMKNLQSMMGHAVVEEMGQEATGAPTRANSFGSISCEDG